MVTSYIVWPVLCGAPCDPEAAGVLAGAQGAKSKHGVHEFSRAQRKKSFRGFAPCGVHGKEAEAKGTPSAAAHLKEVMRKPSFPVLT